MPTYLYMSCRWTELWDGEMMRVTVYSDVSCHDVSAPPKLIKWGKRMKWETDYSRDDGRLWNQTSVQRWVNWISPLTPFFFFLRAEVSHRMCLFWEIKHLSGQLAVVEAVVFSYSLVFICLHVGIVAGSSQPALPGGIASCKKLSTRFYVLRLAVWAHYCGLASAVQFITLRLSNLFLSDILRKCD